MKDFLKVNKWSKSEYDRHLGVLMQTIPIDIIIEKNKWYHLDKQRNKLYHEQIKMLWSKHNPDLALNPDDNQLLFPVRRLTHRLPIQ